MIIAFKCTPKDDEIAHRLLSTRKKKKKNKMKMMMKVLEIQLKVSLYSIGIILLLAGVNKEISFR